jgi:pyruvate formate lyase activating enzyme
MRRYKQIKSEFTMRELAKLNLKGCITNIQRFSVDDGPGIRTTVFLKGCTLRCAWCHNPETISPRRQLQFQEHGCKDCLACAAVCPSKAHFEKEGKHCWNVDACDFARGCNGSFACERACLYGALSVAGEELDAGKLVEKLLRDKPFYRKSGGGVTVSGGEPLFQADFTAEVLRLAGEAGLHTALDTAGNVPWAGFEKVLPYADLILYDLKIADAVLSEKFIGRENHLILENFGKLLKTGKEIWVRIPLMAGLNDGEAESRGRAKLLAGAANITRVDLLPYHSYGAGKYANLGMDKAAHLFLSPTVETMEAVKSLMTGLGVNNVYIG